MWGKYVETARVTLTSKLVYISDFLTRSLLLGIFLFTFMQIWQHVIPTGGRLEGMTVAQLVWYMAMTETVMLSMPRLEGSISDDVKSGSIAYLLSKPMDYVGYQYAMFSGEIILRILINAVIATFMAWLMVGPIPWPPLGLLAWAITATFGVSLSFLIATSLALLAFWVEDVLPLFWIYQKFLFTVGGLFAPIAIFPSSLRWVAEHLPFNFIFAAPARLFIDFQWADLQSCLINQLIWLLLFFVISRGIFRKGVRIVHVNGG